MTKYFYFQGQEIQKALLYLTLLYPQEYDNSVGCGEANQSTNV